MVAIVTGAGLGLERSSGWVLGSRGQLGDAAFGRYGENVYVNAATGNLIINRTDEILIGKGPDNILSRTYNSMAATGAYNHLGGSLDNWQLNVFRRVGNFTGNSNHNSGAITLYDWDGSEMVFAWDADQTAYLCQDGAGAYDTLTFANSEWTWTDGNSRITDVFSDVGTNNGRIKRTVDSDGNTLSYTYTDGYLTTIDNDNGESTEFDWDETGKLSRIRSAVSGGGDPWRVSYTYDGSNRLSTVTTDLTPYFHNDTPDSSDPTRTIIVVTTYTYDGTSDRIASITQTGGAKLEILYYSGDRVQRLTQTTSDGVTRATNFSYASDANHSTWTVTTITDALSQATKLTSDEYGRLVRIELPPAQDGATAQVIAYTYDSSGNVLSATDASGNKVDYRYNDSGDLITQRDQLGNTISRTYGSNNELLTETRWLGPDPDAIQTGTSPSGPQTTRFAYDEATNHLRFIVSAEGYVTEYGYFTSGNGDGSQKYAIRFRDDTYGATSTVSESDLETWTAGKVGNRTDYTYDFRGALATTTSYSELSGNGTAPSTGTNTVVTYTYSPFGLLLSRQTSGTANSETFLYDGLGRLTQSTDLNSATTEFLFYDGTNKTIVELDNGFVRTSMYNFVGELISYAEGGDASTTYKYDSLGRLRMVTDPLGNKHYYLYDAVGRKVADIAADGAMTEYVYDASNRLIKTIAYANKVSNLSALVVSGNPANIAVGDVRPQANASDRWEWRIYDQADRLTKIIDGAGGVTVFAYDGASNLLSTIAYANVVTVDESWKSVTGTMPPANTLPSADSARDVTVRNFYDADGRLAGVLNGEGYFSRIIYDSAGQKAETVAYFNAPTSSQSMADIVAHITTAAQDVHNWYFYDGRGLLRLALDAKLRPTEYLYDGAGQLLKQIEYSKYLTSTPTSLDDATDEISASGFASAADRETWSFYNSDTGNLTYTVDAAGGVTSYGYDSMGRVVKQVRYGTAYPTTSDPTAAGLDTWVPNHTTGSRISRMVYDSNGRLAYAIDAEDYVTEYRYDADNRITLEVRYVDGYDPGDGVTQALMHTHFPTIPSSAVQIAYSYDAAGRLSDSYDGGGIRTHLDYDGVGRVTYRTLGYGLSSQRQTRYQYDQAGRLEFETFAVGEAEQTKTRYKYDGLGRLTETVRAPGEDEQTTTHYEYDNAGQMLSETAAYQSAYASATRYVYNALGEVTDRIVADGSNDASGSSTTHYVYDKLGRVTVETRGYDSSEATPTTYTYNALGDLTDVKVGAGTDEAVTFRTYDLLGRVKTETKGKDTADAATIAFEYDAFGNVQTVTDALTNETSYEYDKRGLVTSVTDPLGETISYVYDAYGNVLKTTYPRLANEPTHMNAAFSFYDKLNRVTLQVDQQGYATATTYTFAGEVETVTRYATKLTATITPGVLPTISPDSTEDATTTFTRDKLGRVTDVTDAMNVAEHYSWNDLGQRTQSVNKLGGTTTYTYNKRGLLETETVAMVWYDSASATHSSVTNRFVYDRRGNRISTIEADGTDQERTTTYKYDKLDRLTETSHDAVQIVNTDTLQLQGTAVVPKETIAYDTRGNVIQTTDAAGACTLCYYDDLDRKTWEINAAGTLSNWQYDDNGNVVKVRVYNTAVTLPTNPGGACPFTSIADGDCRVTTYAYDDNNRLTTTTVAGVRTGAIVAGVYVSSAGAVTVTNIYDDLGNVIQQTDGRTNSVFFYYDRLNRKVAQVDQEGYLTTYTLDADGNVSAEKRYATPISTAISSTEQPAGTSHADDRITNFTYDKNGRRLTEKRTGVVYYTIGSQGTLTGATTGTATISYEYNALGEVTKKTEATGDVTVYEYDNAGRQLRIKAQSYTDVDGNTAFPVVEQFYDALNNLVRSEQSGRVEDTPGHLASSQPTARVTTYAYDYAHGGRLDSVTDAAGFTRNYGYDIAGRVVKESYARNAVNEANATRYDAAGRVVFQSVATKNSSGVWSFGDSTQVQYNVFGEVAKRGVNVDAQDPVWQETFSYDAAGHMWKSNTGDGTTRLYVYDANGAQTLQISSSGVALSSYAWSSITIDNALGLLTNSGQYAIGSHEVTGMVLTETEYDKRGQATATREPLRQLAASGSPADIVRSRTYNAFGEVKTETDPRDTTWITEYAYNTLGKLIQRKSPTVDWTDETGTLHDDTDRPTENYFYDKSGRLIGVQDANAVRYASDHPTTPLAYTNKRTLLAGTGYGEDAVSVLKEFHADGGVYERKYDVFGDMRKEINEVGKNETFEYDAMGRLITQTHESRGDGTTRLVDHYTYDKLGHRQTHWNNQFGNTVVETTGYDAQGRVISMVDMGGNSTTYGYSGFTGTIATTGLGTFGGWTKTTVNSAGLTATEKVDYFGRTVDKVDFGGHNYDFTFDLAGRLASRTVNSAGTTTYAYYNTGFIKTITTGSVVSSYEYDEQGNRTLEKYVSGSTTLQNATVTWDAMNRMSTFGDIAATTGTPTITWKYDLSSNIRNMHAIYNQIDDNGNVITGTDVTQDYWYKYDSMNRFTTTMAAFDTATNTITGGIQLTYDAAGRRHTKTTDASFLGHYDLDTGATEDEIQSLHYTRMETYVYSADGYLASVSTTFEFIDEEGAEPQDYTYTSASYTRDAMGRVTTYRENSFDTTVDFHTNPDYTVNPYAVDLISDDSLHTDVYMRVATYDTKSQVTQDVVTTVRADGTWIATTTYNFNAETSSDSNTYTGAYQGGIVTHQATHTDMPDDDWTNAETRTTYEWWDQAEQLHVDYDAQAHTGGAYPYESHFTRDANGHLTHVEIDDGRPRDVDFITDADGRVLQRHEDEEGTAPSTEDGDPMELHYYFNGIAVGDVGNNGTSDIDYAASIAEHTRTPGAGPFMGGRTNSQNVRYADFDQSYDPINGLTYESTASRYTVQSGDTLESIAYAIWGDASYWYMLADSNGLTGGETLIAGQNLIVPNKVHNAHNSSDTYRVYDPNEAIGDTSPTAPKPAKKAHGACGGFGQILLTVIALAVTAIVAPYLVEALGPILGGALAGAAGSIVSQGAGVATGIQSKFDWGGVAMAAIGGGVNGALGLAIPGSGLGAEIARGVLGSAITQGIGVATGLQKKFDWASVAAAGVMAGVSHIVSNAMPGHAEYSATGQLVQRASLGNQFISGMAGALAGAGAATLFNGRDFGDNLMALLPSVIGQTIGNAVAGRLNSEGASGAEDVKNVPKKVFTTDPSWANNLGGVELYKPSSPAGPQVQPDVQHAIRKVISDYQKFSHNYPLPAGVHVATAADLAIPKTGADAPSDLYFSRKIAFTFEERWAESFPNGLGTEQGETIIANKSTGELGVDNIGGLTKTTTNFVADLNLDDPVHFKNVGIPHTHPFSPSQGGYRGVSFSGGDVTALINTPEINFIFAQSGSEQFLLLKTGQTPVGTLSESTMQDWQEHEVQRLMLQGSGTQFNYPQAINITVLEMAAKYNLVYYTGAHGVLHRVYP